MSNGLVFLFNLQTENSKTVAHLYLLGAQYWK